MEQRLEGEGMLPWDKELALFMSRVPVRRSKWSKNSKVQFNLVGCHKDVFVEEDRTSFI